MTEKSSNAGLTVKKDENFSEWYTQVLEKAEITDIRNNIKGFVVIRPWGASIIENMYRLYEEEMKNNGHKPTFFPVVIPEKNFTKESSHIKGFTPEVFWLEPIKGEDRLALRPTSETSMYQMYSIWIRSWRDLPLKLYQRANVFRFETKATRPLIRSREFYWIEGHDCFATEDEAHKQVEEDIKTTEKVMHEKFGVPFIPIKRPDWDKFAGAIYTIGSDVLMPDGKIIQQPSTHFLGQNFSKAFDIKFKDSNGVEKYVWQTCYGPAQSRILASIISLHGDDKGLVLPFSISPIQVIIIPIFNKENKEKILKEIEKISNELKKEGLIIEIDSSEKRPGEKFYEWELKGIPFRLEIGENEIKQKKATIFLRDLQKKEEINIKNLKKIKEMGKEYDERIKNKANSFLKGKIVDCKNLEEIRKSVDNKKIARINFCSINKSGEKCAEKIEKETGSSIRGIRADKNEKTNGNCVICKKKALTITYAARSY